MNQQEDQQLRDLNQELRDFYLQGFYRRYPRVFVAWAFGILAREQRLAVLQQRRLADLEQHQREIDLALELALELAREQEQRESIQERREFFAREQRLADLEQHQRRIDLALGLAFISLSSLICAFLTLAYLRGLDLSDPRYWPRLAVAVIWEVQLFRVLCGLEQRIELELIEGTIIVIGIIQALSSLF